MSNTIAEQVLASIAATLTAAASMSGATVFRERKDALALGEGIAVVLEPEVEEYRKISDYHMSVDLMCIFNILVRGNVPNTTADPIRVAMHSLIMADPTIGGLVQRVIPHATNWAYEEADITAAVLECRYRFVFACKTNNLTMAA